MFFNLWNVTVNGRWQNKMQGNNISSFPVLEVTEEGKALLSMTRKHVDKDPS